MSAAGSVRTEISLVIIDAQHVVAAVIDDVSRFVGAAEQADDMTVLALRRVGAAAAI